MGARAAAAARLRGPQCALAGQNPGHATGGGRPATLPTGVAGVHRHGRTVGSPACGWESPGRLHRFSPPI